MQIARLTRRMKWWENNKEVTGDVPTFVNVDNILWFGPMLDYDDKPTDDGSRIKMANGWELDVTQQPEQIAALIPPRS